MSGALQRALSVILSATILLLTALSVSPTAHERLHADAGDASHTCAVTLYAQGITSPVCHVEIPVPFEHPEELARVAAAELRLLPVRYWLRPLRGPPVS